MTLINFYSAT